MPDWLCDGKFFCSLLVNLCSNSYAVEETVCKHTVWCYTRTHRDLVWFRLSCVNMGLVRYCICWRRLCFPTALVSNQHILTGKSAAFYCRQRLSFSFKQMRKTTHMLAWRSTLSVWTQRKQTSEFSLEIITDSVCLCAVGGLRQWPWPDWLKQAVEYLTYGCPKTPGY